MAHAQAKTDAAQRAQDFKNSVLDSIIQAMNDPTPSAWVRTWADFAPRSGSTGRVYAGLNFFALAYELQKKGYSDPRWFTYKGGLALGGQVRKGEKGTHIQSPPRVFNPKDKATGQPLQDANGKPIWVKSAPSMFVVFNVDQFDGLNLEPWTTPPPPGSVEAVMDTITPILPNVAPINIEVSDKAFYSPSRDIIVVPAAHQYGGDVAEFAHTILHEAAHSTGHASRLNRPSLVNTDGFGGELYAKEELVADLSAILAAIHLGFEVPDSLFNNSLAYLTSWARKVSSLRTEDARAELGSYLTQATSAVSYMLRTQADNTDAE